MDTIQPCAESFAFVDVVIWCRNWILYNHSSIHCLFPSVVIWCRNWILYNARINKSVAKVLWFDVEIGYYTTLKENPLAPGQLWFDVEIGYYTTDGLTVSMTRELWFDVEIGYYTTLYIDKCPHLGLWFDVEIGYYTTWTLSPRTGIVVIWCRNWILYNFSTNSFKGRGLWFDVEIGYYTTTNVWCFHIFLLWFDVEIGYYTTMSHRSECR